MPKFSSRLAYCVLAAAAAIASSSAHAQSIDMSAGISQYRYQLIDLDLNDNITPSIVFTEFMDRSFSLHTLENEVIAADSIHTLGTTSISSRGGFASTRSDASSWRSLAHVDGAMLLNGSMSASTTHSSTFILSPNTGIMFSAVAEISGEVSPLGPGDSAVMNVRMQGDISSRYGSDNAEMMDFTESYSKFTSGTQTYKMSGYLHSNQQEVMGSIRFSTDAVARVVSAVPEPESYAMLLAGLGLVGFCTRRKGAR
ncbi:hypothetical protein CR152_32040 [Massilia violaceinigra]|uniref:Ice-binding protein C-terminal domain-containing protein n=1 Tax=Massilia violaceinigra TaxID=2045208 RepID=A0A2D2DIN3_9BURK|nr:PEP-CTERM sorting domain-containing protein [Massilia violaceinigra]ATQ74843.1 hypothetical protein CR152_10140 [Massilia violaceinigra]ATQ78637.1 hypothetical protein CR152_32040 [Massilia violaceinigra]